MASANDPEERGSEVNSEDEWESAEPIPVSKPPIISNQPTEQIPRGPTVVETDSGRSEYVPQVLCLPLPVRFLHFADDQTHKVRLLKRNGSSSLNSIPLARSSSGGSSGSGSGSKSLAEREAEYAAARARIFGEAEASAKAAGSTDSTGGTPTNQNTGTTKRNLDAQKAFPRSPSGNAIFRNTSSQSFQPRYDMNQNARRPQGRAMGAYQQFMQPTPPMPLHYQSPHQGKQQLGHQMPYPSPTMGDPRRQMEPYQLQHQQQRNAYVDQFPPIQSQTQIPPFSSAQSSAFHPMYHIPHQPPGQIPYDPSLQSNYSIHGPPQAHHRQPIIPPEMPDYMMNPYDMGSSGQMMQDMTWQQQPLQQPPGPHRNNNSQNGQHSGAPRSYNGQNSQ
ncbi:hypothetical protein DFS34DRAFT_596025 [Phlyctochytrium arcticum]|nr:hypothetical protein DFS34DRAFT_596025 [Phlyctochytrium arcticum]